VKSSTWKTIILIAMVACIAIMQAAWAAPQPNADRDRGGADARAAFDSGHPAIYLHLYSNMPNGPDDPHLARARDLLVTVLREKGIEARSFARGCIPSPGLDDYAAGFNAVAEPLLASRLGAHYMEDVKAEVARRKPEQFSADAGPR
jgi:hypothetical protein